MSASKNLRATAQRALGVADAGEVSATLGELHQATVALQSSVENLLVAQATDREEQRRLGQTLAAVVASQQELLEQLAELRAVVLDQAAAIEQLQGQRSAGPGR